MESGGSKNLNLNYSIFVDYSIFFKDQTPQFVEFKARSLLARIVDLVDSLKNLLFLRTSMV